ncbi:hypothetical protein Bca4012_053039 [Brassica carinata]
MERIVTMTDEEVMKHFEKAKLLNGRGDYVKALELLDDLISVYRLQGRQEPNLSSFRARRCVHASSARIP